MAKNKEKAGAGKTIVILLVVLLLLLTAGAYGYGVHYFSSHFLPGSMVNGFNCSYMTSEDTEDLLNQRVSAYVLAVETMKNGQEAISAQDVGLSYVSTGIVKQLIKDQDRFTWFLAFNQDKNYDISESLSYNVELMGQAVDNLKCMQPENVVQPVDAQIQDTGDTFEIIPEVMGNALDCTKTEEVISAAMLRGKTSVNLEDESCYRKPSVYSTDELLKANCEKMNQLVKVIITYDFADRTETVDRTLIKNWFGYDEDGNVILDENLVRQYVADLGLKYDTMGQTRTFLTYDNRQVEIKGGDYGWVIDQDEEVKALIEAVESGVTQVREPVYLYSGYSRGTNDIGSTYVEIDLTNQRLVFYQKGTPIVDTPIAVSYTHLDVYKRQEYENKLILMDTQMKALESQINAHFLYNTLEAINSLAEIEGEKEISTMALALGDMFRYSIKTKGAVVILEKELCHVENFVAIQQIRFDNAFIFNMDVPQELLSSHILKLTLQPLVENALYHGLLNCSMGSTITLSARKAGGKLYFSVTDDGVGISGEAMEQLRKSLMKKSSFTEPNGDGNGSIGLKNINSRIQLYYGEQYGVNIVSETGKGTTVTICVPEIE